MMLSAQEVATHNSRESCWIIVAGQAYDVTEFLDEHPGGSAIILRYAGRDATEEYEPIHPPTALEENLPTERRLGPIDPATVVTAENKPAEPARAARDTNEKPPLSSIVSLLDFEVRLMLLAAISTRPSTAYLRELYVGSGSDPPLKESMGLLFFWCHRHDLCVPRKFSISPSIILIDILSISQPYHSIDLHGTISSSSPA